MLFTAERVNLARNLRNADDEYTLDPRERLSVNEFVSSSLESMLVSQHDCTPISMHCTARCVRNRNRCMRRVMSLFVICV
jgi:hypothetical protein